MTPWRGAAGAAFWLVLLATWTGVAAAHGGGARFDDVEAAEVAPGSVELTLDITYEDDGEPATGAIIEVVPSGPEGQVSRSVRMERAGQAGSYRARFDLAADGTWTLAVSSSFPPGDLEVEVEVGADGASTLGTTSSTTTNLVVAAAFGTIGGAAGLWVSNRRAARRRAERA